MNNASVPALRVNIIDFLMNCNLTNEQRMMLQTKRPTPNLSIKNEGTHHKRNFQRSWYTRFPWLTGCNVRNKMFCYVCLLFGVHDPYWCKKGLSDLGNIIKKAEKHQASKHHLLNSEAFHLLGKNRIEYALSEADRLGAIKHNEIVSSNRSVLKRLIQSVIFLSKQELPFLSEKDESANNKGNYLELLDLLAQSESIIRDHLQSVSLFKGTTSGFQNDLVEVVCDVVNERIKQEISQSPFISIQIDETQDVSCKSEVSIIMRYCVNYRIEERFVGFYGVSKNKTADELSELVRHVLSLWGVDAKKVICQTYDGASLMVEKGEVKKLVKMFCPHALFIHCHVHQLNLVLLHGARTIKEIRLFVSALTAFRSFFGKFSEQTILLDDRGLKLSQADRTRWNFHASAVVTIMKYFANLYKIFVEIINDDDSLWDIETVNSAIGLKRHMDDPIFVFLLCVFDACYVHTDPLFFKLQSSIMKISQKEIRNIIANIENLRKDSFADRCIEKSIELNKHLEHCFVNNDSLRRLAIEVVDSQITQLKIRFEDHPNLDFLNLVNEERFKYYNKQYPVRELDNLIMLYPIFDYSQLENELSNVYADESKHRSPQELLKFLIINGLHAIYQELTKLLQLVLMLPTAAANSEQSMFTLKRIKTYLRNSMKNNSLLGLNSLAIEKRLLHELSSDPAFLERAIDGFAQKYRQEQLIYKIV